MIQKVGLLTHFLALASAKRNVQDPVYVKAMQDLKRVNPIAHDIRVSSIDNPWHGDLSAYEDMNNEDFLRGNEQLIKINVQDGFKGDFGPSTSQCFDSNNKFNPGCLFFNYLREDMKSLASHHRYDASERTISGSTRTEKDQYCPTANTANCVGPPGHAQQPLNFQPAFAGLRKFSYLTDVEIADYIASIFSQSKQNSTVATKGWLMMMSETGPITNFFEGEEIICNLLGGQLNNGKKVCNMFVAKEFCWRHGAELVLPDTLHKKFILDPLCGANDQSYSLSDVNYWVDAQKLTKTVGGQTHIAIVTTSKVNMMNHLHGCNVYYGIKNSLDVQNILNINLATMRTQHLYTYQQMMAQRGNENIDAIVNQELKAANFPACQNPRVQFNNGVDLFIPVTELEKRTNVNAFITLLLDRIYNTRLAELTAIDNLATSTFDNTLDKDRDLFASTLAASTALVVYQAKPFSVTDSHLNYDWLKSTLSGDTFNWQQDCFIFKCDSANKQVNYESKKCDQTNNRPFCAMNRFISAKIVCPSEIKGVEFCGDDIKPHLMTTIYGNPVKNYKLSGDGKTYEEIGYTLGKDGMSTTPEGSTNAISALNHYLSGAGSNIKRKIFMRCDTVSEEVDGALAISNGKIKTGGFVKSYFRTLCDRAGFSLNAARTGYDYTSTGKNCACNCQKGLEWNARTDPPTAGKPTLNTDLNTAQLKNVIVHADTAAKDLKTAELRTDIEKEYSHALANPEEIQKAHQIYGDFQTLASLDTWRQTPAINIQRSDIAIHCCPIGETFVSDLGYEYGHIAVRYDTVNEKFEYDTTNKNLTTVIKQYYELDCGISYCKEQNDLNNPQYFFDSGTTKSPERFRYDFAGKAHKQVQTGRFINRDFIIMVSYIIIFFLFLCQVFQLRLLIKSTFLYRETLFMGNV